MQPESCEASWTLRRIGICDISCQYVALHCPHVNLHSVQYKYHMASIVCRAIPALPAQLSPRHLPEMLSKMRRRLLLALASVLVLGLICYQLYLTMGPGEGALFTEAGFGELDALIREQMHFHNYKFRLADKFAERTGGWEQFEQRPLDDKCVEFFKFVDAELPDWHLHALHDRPFDKNAVRKGNYFREAYKKIRKEKKSAKVSDPSLIAHEDNLKVEDWYQEGLRRTIESEQEMADSVTILRLIGHCFFKRDSSSFSEPMKELHTRYSKKVVPFFVSELPGVSFGDITPALGKYYNHSDLPHNGDLLDFFYKNMEGTGIVISAATRYAKDIVKFIHLLRAVGNTLPIQVMYRQDLLTKAKEAIILAATLAKEDFLGEELTNRRQMEQTVQRLGMSLDDLKKADYPVQDIAVINMHKPLRLLARADFSSYNNKILALVFCSFQNVIFFDADTVPLVSPDDLAKMKEFTDTGAYFFKDRSLLDTNDWIETNFFAKMMPHKSSALDMAMGVKPVTEHTMLNEYMRGWRHCQEAGLFLLDRKKHFSMLLTLLPLSLWGEPIKSLIWGDKEMYWLAMSLAGDEEYTFNKYNAASVGQATEDLRLKHYNKTKSMEVCSSHPGHISQDGKLLWINSGFSYCKKNGYARDQTKFPYKVIADREKLKDLFDSPLKIRHAIVPPILPALRPLNGPADLVEETNFRLQSAKRKNDVDIINVDQILDYGPQKGWVKSPICSGYHYCAYNEIDAFDDTGKFETTGTFVAFDEEDIQRFDLLAGFWNSGLRVSSLLRPFSQKEGEETAKEPEPESKVQEAVKNPKQPQQLPKVPEQKADTTLKDNNENQEGSNQVGTDPNAGKGEVAKSVEGAPNNVQKDPAQTTDAKDSLDAKDASNSGGELKILDRLGQLLWSEGSEAKAGTTAKTKPPVEDPDEEFSNDETRNRPEKLKQDMKQILDKLKSSSKTA